jgi:hypothetical protein
VRARVAWALAFATSSCAIVAHLGDRTLGDLFSDDGGADGSGDGSVSSGDGDIGDGGSGDAPRGCVVDNFPAPLVEAQIYLAVDTSASMTENLPEGGTRFVNELQAVDNFVHEPLSAPLNVAMSTHPPGGNAACDPTLYASPQIAMGKLGMGTADAIANLLGAVAPAGPSPWSATLTGALQNLTTAAQKSPERLTALIFIADGTPTACDLDGGQLVAIVAPPAQANPEVRTFTVGITDVPTDVAEYFDPIARAGGTEASYAKVPPSATTMLAALEAIRNDIACNVALPQIGGKPADLANGVLFVRATTDVTIARVANAAACATQDAYYPGLTADRVHLCPAACARLLGDAAAKAYVAACKP